MKAAFADTATTAPNQGQRSGVFSSFELAQYPRIVPSAEVTSEIRRFDPPAQTIKRVDMNEACGQLLTFSRSNNLEFEFLLRSHLIIFFPDGIPGGCEWRNDREIGKLSSIVPNALMFNPAQERLHLRMRPSRNCRRVLTLTIQPSAISRIKHQDIDVNIIRVPQTLGLRDQGLVQTLVEIEQEIETPELNSASYMDALFTLLLTRLVRCAVNFATRRQSTGVRGGLPNWRLKRALELLESDLAKAPSLAELAQPLRLHPASFCRAFKQSTGVSPHRYLLAHRVSRAKEIMNDTKCSLTQIALDCGFSSSSQFSVAFKRIVGVAPREYRRSL